MFFFKRKAPDIVCARGGNVLQSPLCVQSKTKVTENGIYHIKCLFDVQGGNDNVNVLLPAPHVFAHGDIDHIRFCCQIHFAPSDPRVLHNRKLPRGRVVTQRLAVDSCKPVRAVQQRDIVPVIYANRADAPNTALAANLHAPRKRRLRFLGYGNFKLLPRLGVLNYHFHVAVNITQNRLNVNGFF